MALVRRNQNVYTGTTTANLLFSEECKLSERVTLIKGTKFKLIRQHGTYTFMRHVVNEYRKSEWVDCIDRNGQIRSFYIDSIKGLAKVVKRRVR